MGELTQNPFGEDLQEELVKRPELGAGVGRLRQLLREQGPLGDLARGLGIALESLGRTWPSTQWIVSGVMQASRSVVDEAFAGELEHMSSCPVPSLRGDLPVGLLPGLRRLLHSDDAPAMLGDLMRALEAALVALGKADHAQLCAAVAAAARALKANVERAQVEPVDTRYPEVGYVFW